MRQDTASPAPPKSLKHLDIRGGVRAVFPAARRQRPPRGSAENPAVHQPDSLVDRLIDRGDRAHREWHLAVARLAASLILVTAMQVGSDAYHSPAATAVMAVYAVYAWTVLVLQRRFAICAASGALVCHTVDFAWATVATAMSGGTSSHTFMLFLLVIAAGAYRWNLRGSVATGAAVLVVACGEALAANAGLLDWPFEYDTFVLLPLSVVVFSILFGLLAEGVHVSGAQAIAIGEVLSRTGQAAGTAEALHIALVRLAELFEAREAIVAVREEDPERSFIWQARTRRTAPTRVSRSVLSPAERAIWFFPAPPHVTTFEFAVNRTIHPVAVHMLDGQGVATGERREPFDLPRAGGWRTLTVTLAEVPRCWQARVFLVDARKPRAVALRLPLLQRFVQQVTPALASLYLTHRLRSRAEERERGRLARELHDGVIQTLAVLDMRIEMASRRVEAVDPALSSDLRGTRDLVRADVMRLRELIERVRPTRLKPRQLPGALTDLAERFSRMSGIEANVIWCADSAALTSRQSEELLRIAQEGFVNARRHSAATRVTLRIAADVSGWEVILEDNGVGFPFAGHRTHRELGEQNQGPRVIRERVEVLGGSLSIDSSPDGSRLEIVFPRAQSAA